MKSYTANFVCKFRVWLNMGDRNVEEILCYYTKQLSCWCSVVEVEVVVVLQTDTVDRALLPPCLPAPRTAVETHPQHLLRLSIGRGSRVRPAKGRGRNWHQSFTKKRFGNIGIWRYSKLVWSLTWLCFGLEIVLCIWDNSQISTWVSPRQLWTAILHIQFLK